MRKYCNIVKKKLNMLIRSMEKNVSDFVVDPKRDFVRKSELSFSKTMRLFSEEQRYFLLLSRIQALCCGWF